MVLPEGDHKVEFRFEPVVYTLGETLSRISSLVFIVLALGAVILEFRKSKKSPA
jgi:hypothetical protein